jgi:DNA-directed RNA polymerase specialized sigma24 family protein
MFYAKIYRDDEPVTKTQRTSSSMSVKFNDKFFDKLLVDLALDVLPKHLRDVAERVICDHIHPDDVADELGVHRSTVYRRLVRAESFIRKFIEEI